MIVVAAIAAMLVFAIVFRASGLMRVGFETVAATRTAIATLRDGTLSDRDRERAARRASIVLFGACASIGFRIVIVLGVSLSVISVIDLFGLAETSHVLDFMFRWEVIAGAAVTIPLALRAIHFLTART